MSKNLVHLLDAEQANGFEMDIASAEQAECLLTGRSTEELSDEELASAAGGARAGGGIEVRPNHAFTGGIFVAGGD